MSESSNEVRILREMLDIHEQSTRMLHEADIELSKEDRKTLKRLERELQDETES